MDCVLGIDVGTTRVKASVLDSHGNVRSRVGERRALTGETASEYDPYATWRSVMGCVRELADAGALDRVEAVGVCGHGDGCLLVDSAGEPVRAGIDWTDGRAGGLLERWGRGGALAVAAARLPAPLFPGSTLAVLAWLERNEPDAVARASSLMFAKDWVRLCLTGALGTDRTDAYLVAPAGNGYSTDAVVAEALGIETLHRLCPPVRDSCEIVGTVRQQAAAALGLRAGTPVIAGAMDMSAAAVGVGLGEAEGFSVLGTTAIHSYRVDAVARASASAFLVPWPGDGGFLYGMAPSSASGNLSWIADLLWPGRGGESLQLAEQAAAGVAPGSAGVSYLPFLNEGGERAPFTDPRARAQFAGLSPSHHAGHLVRAVLEGVAFAALDSYSSLGEEPHSVVLTGGGANSRLWCQIVSDVLAARIDAVHADDAGCQGIALLAAGALGGEEPSGELSSARRGSARFEPSARSPLYRELFGAYREQRSAAAQGWAARRDDRRTAGAERVEQAS